MTDEPVGFSEVASTLRLLAPAEAQRLFLAPTPEHDYRFYVLDPPPATDGWIAEGQWVDSLHVAGWSVLGVWEMQREPLLLRVQMLLGIFASRGVLPLEFKPAYSVGDLLLQHLEALEQGAEEKGGVQQLLADHAGGSLR